MLSCQMNLSCFHHPPVILCVLLPLTRFWVAWIPGHADRTASDLCITKLFLGEKQERGGIEWKRIVLFPYVVLQAKEVPGAYLRGL